MLLVGNKGKSKYPTFLVQGILVEAIGFTDASKTFTIRGSPGHIGLRGRHNAPLTA